MRTLEMALRAETKKQQWYRRKLQLDIFIQVGLYTYVLVAAFSYEIHSAFIAHYFLLGFYQVISCSIHPIAKKITADRIRYETWMNWHLIALVPCIFAYPFLVLFMLTSTLLALYYLWITVKEFYESC